MRLEVSPIYDNDPARTEFLKAYVYSKFQDALQAVRPFIHLSKLPFDPWNAFEGLLHVEFWPGDVPYLNGTVSGLHSGGEFYRGFYNPKAYSKVDVNWDHEYTKGLFTLQHELQNFLNFHSGTNPNLGYATSDDPAIVDAKLKFDRLYHGDVLIFKKSRMGQPL